MKAIVLKPIMWNTNEYKSPSGYESSSGFSKDYGYGHEEWNNNPNRIWRNYKIFHTEYTDKLIEYSATGELGIVTIAALNKTQYAISIATNVFNNEEDERKIIAEELNIYDEWKDIWKLDIVKGRFKNDRNKFITHWREKYEWIRWKCPIRHYLHFKKPIPLDPERISGKSKLISMHGRFQAVYPEQVCDIIKNEVSQNNPIFEWLLNSDFDEEIISKDLQSFHKNRKIKIPKKKGGSNSPSVRKYQYWVEGNRDVEPQHAYLQAKYVKFLKLQGIIYSENMDYVDIQYQFNNHLIFAEIKPAKNIKTKYAIRMAVGQLLEYRFRLNQQAILEIVLDCKPKNEEIDFVDSLKIRLIYYDAGEKNFVRLL